MELSQDLFTETKGQKRQLPLTINDKTIDYDQLFTSFASQSCWQENSEPPQHRIMATAVQKNGIKPLSNGNSLVHHDVKQELAGLTEFGEVQTCAELKEEPQAAPDNEQEIDIVINNVVCSFSVRCHLNLREIALNGMNVEYRKENGMITMKLRRPYTTASIWSSGKVTCTGATSEPMAKVAARRFARCLQKLGFNVHFNNYRVVNVLGTCSMPFAIRINSFSERHKEADYEPELHPGVTYKLKTPKATLKIFSTGSVTVTAPSVADVQAAIEHIFPLVYEFRKERTAEELAHLHSVKRRRLSNGPEDPVCDNNTLYVKEEEEEANLDSEDDL